MPQTNKPLFGNIGGAFPIGQAPARFRQRAPRWRARVGVVGGGHVAGVLPFSSLVIPTGRASHSSPRGCALAVLGISAPAGASLLGPHGL